MYEDRLMKFVNILSNYVRIIFKYTEKVKWYSIRKFIFLINYSKEYFEIISRKIDKITLVCQDC